MRKDNDTNRGSWDLMDCMLLVRDASSELIQLVYFVCKYKEASIIETMFKSHLYLRLSHRRSRIKGFHKEEKVVCLVGTREQYVDIVNYFLGLNGQ
jgi:hypothetical protein